jgi:enoyl-CoA hydratase
MFAKGSARGSISDGESGRRTGAAHPVVPDACRGRLPGNAYPMGAFLILSSDHRIAAEGDYRIGMNEVAIGLTVPRFAIRPTSSTSPARRP